MPKSDQEEKRRRKKQLETNEKRLMIINGINEKWVRLVSKNAIRRREKCLIWDNKIRSFKRWNRSEQQQQRQQHEDKRVEIESGMECWKIDEGKRIQTKWQMQEKIQMKWLLSFRQELNGGYKATHCSTSKKITIIFCAFLITLSKCKKFEAFFWSASDRTWIKMRALNGNFLIFSFRCSL